MSGDTAARAGMAVVFGGIALALTVNADCSGLPDQSCTGVLGTTMPQVDRLHSVLWIAAAAAFGWYVFSTVSRVKILVTTLLGGVVGFWIAVGATALFAWREGRIRYPAIVGTDEGYIFIFAFFALIGVVGGAVMAFFAGYRRWARDSDDRNPGATDTTRAA